MFRGADEVVTWGSVRESARGLVRARLSAPDLASREPRAGTEPSSILPAGERIIKSERAH